MSSIKFPVLSDISNTIKAWSIALQRLSDSMGADAYKWDKWTPTFAFDDPAGFTDIQATKAVFYVMPKACFFDTTISFKTVGSSGWRVDVSLPVQYQESFKAWGYITPMFLGPEGSIYGETTGPNSLSLLRADRTAYGVFGPTILHEINISGTYRIK